MFSAAVEASHVLYNYLAINAEDVQPQPEYLVGSMRCFRPSASMLTSLETVPGTTAAEIPPLYNHKTFEAALDGGNGKYVFSSVNEVLFFGDEVSPSGYVTVSPAPLLHYTDHGTARRSSVGKCVQARFTLDRLLKSGSNSAC